MGPFGSVSESQAEALSNDVGHFAGIIPGWSRLDTAGSVPMVEEAVQISARSTSSSYATD